MSYAAIARELGIGRERAKKLCGPLPAWLDRRQLVITRHQPLITLLIERGIITADARVIAHATADDVRDTDVVGVLPLHLAALARSVTEVPLELTLVDRAAMTAGDLPIERLREIAGEAVTYVVRTGR
ncbi:MAG: hypothetical protein NUV34_10020 [Sulfuricaulis sp.]|nr:hypothetical protein [Sulfuricaulis sp.]